MHGTSQHNLTTPCLPAAPLLLRDEQLWITIMCDAWQADVCAGPHPQDVRQPCLLALRRAHMPEGQHLATGDVHYAPNCGTKHAWRLVKAPSSLSVFYVFVRHCTRHAPGREHTLPNFPRAVDRGAVVQVVIILQMLQSMLSSAVRRMAVSCTAAHGSELMHAQIRTRVGRYLLHLGDDRLVLRTKGRNNDSNHAAFAAASGMTGSLPNAQQTPGRAGDQGGDMRRLPTLFCGVASSSVS